MLLIDLDLARRGIAVRSAAPLQEDSVTCLYCRAFGRDVRAQMGALPDFGSLRSTGPGVEPQKFGERMQNLVPRFNSKSMSVAWRLGSATVQTRGGVGASQWPVNVDVNVIFGCAFHVGGMVLLVPRKVDEAFIPGSCVSFACCNGSARCHQGKI